MSSSHLDLDTDFYFDVDLLSYQQDEFYMPLDQIGVTEAAEVYPKSGSRVSLACIPCRTRHIKCDAQTPSCSKCRSDNRSCTYMKSRRGGQRTKGRQRQAPLDPRRSERLDIHGYPQCQPAVDNSLPVLVSNSTTPETSEASSSLNTFRDGDYSKTHLLDMYYTNFHDSHPIILPRKYLMARLQSNSAPMEHLEHVMEYIGSLYVTHILSDQLRQKIRIELSEESLPMTGFTVQALMLFALAAHGCNNFGESRVLLDRAITMALEMKMQSRLFAQENGEGNAILEESWRRTWWLLYVMDGTVSGIMHEASFKLFEIPTDVDLPCEEQEYAKGTIPAPKSLQEYETREFADEEIIFSSFAYLVDGARIIGAVLPTISKTGELFDDGVTAADAKLASWLAHLPDCKKQIISDSGEVDEIIFRAHMAINLLGLYLHRPRSRLAYSDVENSSKCTVTPPSEQMARARQKAHAFHTSKAIASLEAVLGMLAIPSPLTKHSPLIICGVAMAIMGQIAACNLVLECDKAAEGRERIRLGIGALKKLADIWPLSRKTLQEIKAIGRELLNIPNGRGIETPMETLPARDGGFYGEVSTLI